MATAMAHDRSRAVPHASADRGARRDPRGHERTFYLAIDRLPLATVASIEFVATIAVALAGVRSLRNLLALLISSIGVYALVGLAGTDDVAGLVLAIANAILFALYIVLGYALAREPDGSAVDRLGAAMIVALVLVAPVGLRDASVAFLSPMLLLAGIGVGCHIVGHPLHLRPAGDDTTAARDLCAHAGAAARDGVRSSARSCCRQIPSSVELLGIGMVAIGIAIHKPG